MHPAQRVPAGPSYQVPLARAVKTAVEMPVIAVRLIRGFDQAEAIVGAGDVDLIALARAILYDPRWPRHAAAELGGRYTCQSSICVRSRGTLVISSNGTSRDDGVTRAPRSCPAFSS